MYTTTELQKVEIARQKKLEKIKTAVKTWWTQMKTRSRATLSGDDVSSTGDAEAKFIIFPHVLKFDTSKPHHKISSHDQVTLDAVGVNKVERHRLVDDAFHVDVAAAALVAGEFVIVAEFNVHWRFHRSYGDAGGLGGGLAHQAAWQTCIDINKKQLESNDRFSIPKNLWSSQG